jgi:hypothetical protein
MTVWIYTINCQLSRNHKSINLKNQSTHEFRLHLAGNGLKARIDWIRVPLATPGY